MEVKMKAKIFGILCIIFLIITNLIPTISTYFISVTPGQNQLEHITRLQSLIQPIFTVLTVTFLLLSILMFSIYFLKRWDEHKKQLPTENAKKILYERYASGEISKQEFEDKNKDIDMA